MIARLLKCLKPGWHATSRWAALSAKCGLPSVSADQTHHVGSDSQPAYKPRYQSVLSFHSPEGLAAVKDVHQQAFHINLHGEPAYPQKFKKTFGFYQGLAAVCDDQDHWFHVNLQGEPVYNETYRWCGNMAPLPVDVCEATAQAPVRTDNGNFFHISEAGKTLGGPYLHAGDPNSAGQSVVWECGGKCLIINADRSVWGEKNIQPINFLDARIPHKGLAAVKDAKGWFFIDRSGKQVGRGRYLEVEPHYNGQARVKLRSGEWAIIDENGKVLHNLGQSLEASKNDLVTLSQSYWPSIALRKIIDTDLLSSLETTPTTSIDPKLKEILLNVGMDLGLCAKESGAENLQLTLKGRLLAGAAADVDMTRDKVKYWLQDRYFKAWLSDASSEAAHPDTFRDISTDKDSVALSQTVLKSYAQDWKGIADFLPIKKTLLQLSSLAPPLVVVDIAGGTGSLLCDVASSLPADSNISLTCLERPEVVAFAKIGNVPSSPVINFSIGDIFKGPLPRADLYLLSRVLHDWDDFRAEQILRRIHKYSKAGATLSVIDRCATSENMHSLLSLHMYQLQKAFERTSSQWLTLFKKTEWIVVDRSTFHEHEIFILEKTNDGRDASTR